MNSYSLNLRSQIRDVSERKNSTTLTSQLTTPQIQIARVGWVSFMKNNQNIRNAIKIYFS